MTKKSATEPVESATKLSCYHCGEDCPDKSIAIGDKYFCCNGCKFVFELLSEHNLDNYYRYEDLPGLKVAERRDKNKYAILDNDEVKTKIVSFTDGVKSRITLSIPQIHCSACIWLLENLDRLNDGVLQARVNFLKKEVSIFYSDEKISLRQLVELLTSIGYEPQLSLESMDKPRKQSNIGRLYVRIAIAGFSFANIMLLSFPEYLDSDGVITTEFARFFGIMNIALALPVLLYSALPYFSSAYFGLKQKVINMDVPISLGIVILFSRSLYEIITETGSGFMDSFAGLVFFLLLGKLFQQKTYDALSFDRDYRSYFPLAVTKITDESTRPTPITQLDVGDIISVKSNELIPCDAVLLEGQALIDYSFVTGESEPVHVPSGKTIYAGGRQNGSSITLEISKKVSQSYITQLWNDAIFKESREASLTSLANRFSKYFTFAVISIALFTFLFWIWFDPSRAFNAVTAVLIVACPCALALSTPFTLGTAVRILGKNGLFVKNSLIIEKMAKIKQIIFDKTGTLTEPESASIFFSGNDLSSEEMSVIGSLASHSTHPLSRRIYSKLVKSDRFEMKPVTSYEEVPGKGISGVIDDIQVAIGSSKFCGVSETEKEFSEHNRTQVYVRIDDNFRGVFTLHSTYREGLSEVIASLTPYNLAILSGDNEREKPELESLFTKQSGFYFNQTPQDKLNFIQQTESTEMPVMMLGDGLNDAGALKQASVGIAVTQDTTAFTPASDAILDGRYFKHLGRFLTFSKKAIHIIFISFAISIVYNLVGLSFAVQSALSPLVAAILMPVSSISVILFATLATRRAAQKIGLK